MAKVSFFQRVLIVFATVSLVVFLGAFFTSAIEAASPPILYFFWGDGCPHCEKEKKFLEELRQRYPELEMRWFETWRHQEFKAFANVIRQAYGVKTSSVPFTVIGNWTKTGFRSPEETGGQIEEQVTACLQNGCIDPLMKVGPLRIAAKIKDEAARNDPVGWELYPASTSETE